jgi:hypothetical protein
MSRILGKKWKPAPLPLEFHLSLDKADWTTALRAYQRHPRKAIRLARF